MHIAGFGHHLAQGQLIVTLVLRPQHGVNALPQGIVPVHIRQGEVGRVIGKGIPQPEQRQQLDTIIARFDRHTFLRGKTDPFRRISS